MKVDLTKEDAAILREWFESLADKLFPGKQLAHDFESQMIKEEDRRHAINDWTHKLLEAKKEENRGKE